MRNGEPPPSSNGPGLSALGRRWNLGNDVVDLADPRHTGKAGDERFLKRVYSGEEREDILSSKTPDRALWIRWAGKEAAFKTISKSLGAPPTFIHSLFRVTVFRSQELHSAGDGDLDPPMTRFGQVRYEDITLPLRIEVAGTALHAVTWRPSQTGENPNFLWNSSRIGARSEAWREKMNREFSPLEWDCISHRASALARAEARRSIAFSLGVDERDLEIGCGPGKPGRRIPKVLMKGREILVDLTLSHHGQLLAWAFLDTVTSS